MHKYNCRKVYLVGRRGPVQAACTAKELREVLGIKDLHVNIQEADLVKTPTDEEELRNSRIQRRVYELLSKAAMSGPSHCYAGQRELHFVFFRKPHAFLDSDSRSGHVAGVRFEKTIVKENVGFGKQVAVGTGQFEDFECRLVLKSIGYKSVPVDGLPFDAYKGIVPNIGGRVLVDPSGDHTQLEGVYVCGWLKRGPTGIIATNLYCAEETIASISEDLAKGVLASAPSLPKPGREGLLQLLDSRNVKTGKALFLTNRSREVWLIDEPRCHECRAYRAGTAEFFSRMSLNLKTSQKSKSGRDDFNEEPNEFDDAK
ncbi:adrenodoxin-NADP(+) reductase [Sarracenia purpurea var. burkii]